ncbi:MAG: DNA-processing protein DprA, partial [Clostridia bacterium]
MQQLEKNRYYIWLSILKNIDISTKIQLLQEYKNPELLYNKTEEDLTSELKQKIKLTRRGKPITEAKEIEKIIENIIDEKTKLNMDKYIERMNKMKINVVSLDDLDYPTNLKQIYDFPVCLYYKGNINLLNDTVKIAMVGSREYSNYGRYVAENFAYKLAKENITIVSGGARGIDSFSHQGAIKSGGKTIAVLGNGLDYIYPPENKELEEKIIANNGLLVSEYVIGTKPSKYTFPERNRIISGISDGVLIVEAKQNSGALITADFALEQGKNIYAIPGNINTISSIGTNEL